VDLSVDAERSGLFSVPSFCDFSPVMVVIARKIMITISSQFILNPCLELSFGLHFNMSKVICKSGGVDYVS
jgi:hypothetical protein